MLEQPADGGVRVVGDVQCALRQRPRDPGVDGAEAQVAPGEVARVGEQPQQLRGRLVRGEPQAVFGGDRHAVEHGAQVLPSEPDVDRHAGRPVPHQGRGALRGDAHSGDRTRLGQRRPGDVEHRGGHRDAVELDQARERARRRHRPVVHRGHRGIRPHDGGAQPRRTDVDHQDAVGRCAHRPPTSPVTSSPAR